MSRKVPSDLGSSLTWCTSYLVAKALHYIYIVTGILLHQRLIQPIVNAGGKALILSGD